MIKKNNLYDSTFLVEKINKFPQTYKTLLSDFYSDGTCQTVVRRKINKLLKYGDICKCSIPGTRFGKALFYVVPKEYMILVESGRTGSVVYCFFKYKKISKFYIKVKKYWKLKKGSWKTHYKEKIFFEGNILLWL